MNKKSIVLILLLTLPIMLPLLATNANAYPVTATPSKNPTIIEWYNGTSGPTGSDGGLTSYATLSWNPEYLSVEPLSPISTYTTIIVQGKDAYQQNIEAQVVLPPGATGFYIFNDTDTIPGTPVAFASITGILQQNGTDNSKFEIWTSPQPFEQYLGQFQNSTGFQPGMYTPDAGSTQYLVTQGPDVQYTVQNVPVEPSNPDPYKIVVNWNDKPNLVKVRDLLPESNEFSKGGAQTTSNITLESLDEHGNKVITKVTIPQGTNETGTIVGCTYSTLCKVWGGDQSDKYYIFTEPMAVRALFFYYIKVDHITIQPVSYDILAYPDAMKGKYPGVTNVTVALRDSDGNLVNAATDLDYGTIGTIQQHIIINFFTSGGVIQPARAIIDQLEPTVTVNLTADTNPRTINVTADANIPKSGTDGWGHGELNLAAWTEMTFDGINLSPSTDSVHTLLCGYTNSSGAATVMNAPFEPALPPNHGGPQATGIKLDGPLYEVSISLHVGCNLISSPVVPMYGSAQYNLTNGIPMDQLFNSTAAIDAIEAIWWYNATAGTWHTYIPGVPDHTANFTDGVGYWIKAEKACTLELSGIAMENAPFTPPVYALAPHSWNLIGVTSVVGITIPHYLGTCAANDTVWVYYAAYRSWTMNPSWGLWPTEAFWVFNPESRTVYIVP